MKQNREHALASILRLEAGYAERPAEGGGAVNHGITFTVFQAWRGLKGQNSVTWADLKAMTADEAVEIYSFNFSGADPFRRAQGRHRSRHARHGCQQWRHRVDQDPPGGARLSCKRSAMAISAP
jgi:hypothetical protein